LLTDALHLIDDDIKVYFAGTYDKNLINQSTKKKINLLYSKYLRAFLKFNAAKNAINIGFVSDINEYIDKSVCIVSPFTVPHFSRPIIEAFGRRKPAIATDIDGIDEIIQHGRNGIIVKLGDPKALADAINYLCKNPSLAKEMGDNAYNTAKVKFSQNNINELSNIYFKMIE